jgi:nitroreductase
MDLSEALRGRRSIRDYADRPVAEETLRAVIAEAVLAPNGLNRQAWAFRVVADRSLLERASAEARAAALAAFAGEPHFAELREHIAAPGYRIFYDAPALIVICATVRDAMARHDCCLAAATLMLAAHGRGLGTCWIGLAEPWLGSAAGRRALGIPPEHEAVAPIIIGHPRALPPARPRRPPEIAWVRGWAVSP